jgi:hypothetical protein
LTVNQTVDTNGATSITAYASLSGYASGGYGSEQFGTPIPVAAAIGALPTRPYAATLTRTQLLDQAKARLREASPLLFAAVVNYMRTYGYGAAWFSLQQALNWNGKTAYLVWTAYLDHQSRPVYGDAQLVEEQPTILYALYTPLAVKRGLPQGWQFPDGGTLRWQLRDFHFNPITRWESVDTQGAYDQPQGRVTDPDLGVRCLVDSSYRSPTASHCPSVYPDLRKLIDTKKATFGVLDYVRYLQPVYTNAPGGSRVAAAAIDVYERSIRVPSCCCDTLALSYLNRYRIGYKLQVQTDRVSVEASGAWRLLSHVSTEAVSPVETKERSVATVREQIALLPGMVIRPDTGILVELAAFPPGQIVHLASVTYQ